MITITISRQYGSGGHEVAAQVCQLLGYGYFDKWLMAQVSKEVALSDNEIVDFSEDNYKVRSFLERLFGTNWRAPRPANPMASLKANVAGPTVKLAEKFDEEYSITLVQSTIHAAYNRGNVVIVGRGGQAILKDKPDTLHVRIEAPDRARAWRIQEREGISLAQARDVVAERDHAAEAYLWRFYNIDWSDPMHYHLVINTGKCHLDAAAAIIADSVKHFEQVAA